MREAMIVAPEPLAVEAGARVLMEGGNAIDAAVTAALVEGVVNPHGCGVGGYLVTTLLPAAAAGAPRVPLGLDAPALAGERVTPAMWQDRVIGPNPAGWGYFLREKINTVGYQSICTPGTVRALASLLERWGTLAWQRAIEPAARIAEGGFLVDPFLAGYWRGESSTPEEVTALESIRLNPEASKIYIKADGSPYQEGELLRNPDYATTLRRLAEAGADDFYQGALAEQMAADLAANGAFVTARDLAEYRLREPEPVTGTYRGYTISTSNAPHGGPTLVAILNILEGYELARMEHNSPEYIWLVSMAMKAAFADRNPFMGDPAFVDVPIDWMISKARAGEWRRRIDRQEPISVAFDAGESPHTTHLCAVDSAGNWVALTHSLGSSSGVISPGLGFMWNNSMVNFHPYPGHPNSIAPGKGRSSGMAPTIVARDGQPVLAIGAPGATRIITAVLQVIVNIIDFGMSVEEAVLAPRFDCQGDVIRCHARIPEYICDEVRRRHPVERLNASHGKLGLVQAITRDPASGRLRGAADTGTGGMALRITR